MRTVTGDVDTLPVGLPTDGRRVPVNVECTRPPEGQVELASYVCVVGEVGSWLHSAYAVDSGLREGHVVEVTPERGHVVGAWVFLRLVQDSLNVSSIDPFIG